MKKFVAAFFGAVLVAGSAQAASLKVELWDVIAGTSTCCAANPSAAAQIAARTVNTGNTVLNNVGGNYISQVDSIIAGEAAHYVFDIDSSLLAGGFSAAGLNGLSTGTDKSLNDFFGFDIDGAGSGIGDNSALGTILRITGYVDIDDGDNYAVRSDDGYRVTIGGDSVERDNLQAPTTIPHTYNGASGVQEFTMVWFENQRVKAALQTKKLDYVSAVPLPAGAPLLLAGLGAFAIARRRKS